MKRRLKEFCRSLGIEYIGITPAGPYSELEKILKKRMEQGRYTGFEEKELEKRINPSLTLPDARSVIVCLFPYFSGHNPKANIAKYTFPMDYHITIKGMLNNIGDFLKSALEGFEYKAFVDSGPLADRYMAYLAGLGFFGINNHIITEKYGSYVFIGYIINNYPFEPDNPIDKTCIQCERCVKACPGNSILGDFEFNPLKCLSYITQKKEELTPGDRDILRRGRLVLGCDICQDVCPHNKGAGETGMEEFRKNLLTNIDYTEIQDISNKEFKRRYGNRAFGWAGRKVIARNFEVINNSDE